MKTNNTGKRRINILDLIAAIVLIAAVTFGVFALAGGDREKQAVKDNITFTLEATGNEPEVLNYIEEGQTVYDNTTKTELGQIVAIHETPTRTVAENHQDKTLEYVEIPNQSDVVLEISGKAEVLSPDIMIDTVEIKIGKRIHCMVGDAAVTCTIIGLDYDEALLSKKEETK